MTAAILAVVVAVVGAPTAAAAASAPLAVPGGPASVSTSVSFVSGADLSTPITDLEAVAGGGGQLNVFALNIGYACGAAAACENVTVAIDPQPMDEFYGEYQFARYSSSTLPSGATIAGSDEAGYTVSLGNLAAGATGAFTVTYLWQTRGLSASPQSFFIDGTQITNTVTIDADNASAIATASDSITWHIATMEPLVAFGDQPLATAGTDYQYNLRMASDCMWYRSTANHGEPAKLCAESYETTFELPTGVEYVATSHDGVYDAASRTVTWADSGIDAATGWGSVNRFSLERTVTVRFPEAMFVDSCLIDVTARLSADVTYLDGAQKTATPAELTHPASNCVPFGASAPLKKVSTLSLRPDIVWDEGNQSWYLDVGNQANVPGVAVITDDGLDQIENVRVYAAVASGGTIDYVLDDGTAGTASDTYSAPAGRSLASVVITSPVLDAANIDPNELTNTTTWRAALRYTVVGDAPAEGWERSNTATAVMTYPGYDLEPHDSGSSTSNIVITPRPANFSTYITATRTGAGNPVAGVPVDYSMHAVTSNVDAGATLEPQYVFLAPADWEIVDGTASLEAGAPAGADFTRTQVVMDGVQHDAIIVTWPSGTTWGVNTSWPALRVQATPTLAATAGSVGTAYGFSGEATHSFTGYAATWGGASNGQRYGDAADIDGDGDTSENFALAVARTTVGAASALTTVKEICRVDETAADGCDWISDATQAVPVSPVAEDITYRVTIRNNGNTALSNVVAYDVLPYIGDTGVSEGSASTPRGSEFAESVASVSAVSANLSLTYSGSTDPCRTEVYPGGPAGCDDDWSGISDGAVSIRAAVNGTLGAGQEASFVYSAAVLGAPDAGAVACNSIATSATGVPVSEPSPVCAVIEAADVAVTATVPAEVQIDRPTTLDIVVSNQAGTTVEPALIVEIPAGVEITSLELGEWVCTAGGATAPIGGPATLECAVPAPLAEGDSTTLQLPAIIRTAGVTIPVSAGDDLYDPALENNSDAIVIDAAPAIASGLVVTKDDGILAAVAGQTIEYVLTVTGELTGETITDVTVTDSLPAGLVPVSFETGDGSGELTGSDLVWTIPTLAPGVTATGTITAMVAEDATATSVSNTVTASAADPAFPDTVLTGTATDVDSIDRITLDKVVTMRAPGDPTDPQPGDLLDYSFIIANTGGGVLTDVELTDPLVGLSEIAFPDGWPSLPGRLGAGEFVRATATYELTAADIDAGGVSNTATVTAASAGGQTADATDSIDYPLPAIGAISLVKDGVAAGASAGDEVTYSFEIANTGNVTLTGVEIDDALAGLSTVEYTWPGEAGVLGAGETATATATYALTQADVDRGSVLNSAIVSGQTPEGADMTGAASDTVVIPANPAATFDKSGELGGDAERPVAGDEVLFTFVVTNTGNVSLSALSIDDQLPGVGEVVFGEWPGETGVLAPGASVEATAVYVLSQADVDAGEVANLATLTASPARGVDVTVDAETTVPLTPAASIALTKEAAIGSTVAAQAGDVVDYTFTLVNDGNVTLSGAQVEDALEGLSDIEYRWNGDAGSLAVGETVTATATYELTQADIDGGALENTATVTATAPNGDEVSAEDTVTTSFEAVPAVSLEKTGTLLGNVDRPVAGDEVQFGFVVVNTGNVTLTGPAITDHLDGVSDVEFLTWTTAEGVLVPGDRATATASYVLTQADIDRGSVDNTATVTVSAGDAGAITADAEVTVPLAPAAGLAITKDAVLDATGVVQAGDVIDYIFEVVNTGNVTLGEVSIDDALAGLGEIEYTWPGDAGTLAPGAVVTASAAYELTQADIDGGTVENTATVSGASVAGDEASASDSVTVEVPPVAAVSFDKAGAVRDQTDRAEVGDVVEYTFTVVNTGNVTLSAASITDHLDGVSEIVFGDWPGDTGVLTPGATVLATATYEVTQSDIDAGEVVNTATLTATPTRGEAIDIDASATVPLATAPGLSLVKDGVTDAETVLAAGDEVTYTFEVSNTGNVTLQGVTIVDELEGLSEVEYSWPGEAGVLAAGESATATAVYVLTQADVDHGSVQNSAIVSGQAPDGTELIGAGSDTVMIPANPAVTFVKNGVLRGDAQHPVAGDEVEFTFTVTNTGNLSVAALEITDHLDGVGEVVFGDWPGDTGELSPGASVAASATYVLTQADVDAGEVVNVATLTGTPVRGVAVDVDAEAVVPLASASGLTITKHAELIDRDGDDRANPGERITYSFELTNTGNVTLRDVTVDDPKVTGVPVIEALAPGESVTVTGEDYVVTEADAIAGEVENTASAFATSADGASVTTDASSTVTVDAARSDDLATTGGEASTPLWLLAGGAVLAGALLLLITRRRREV